MTLQMRQSPTGFTTVCDDIRHEIGAKQTLVGCYSNAMIISAPLPIVLPKLCFFVTYIERVGTETGPLTLQIYLPGDHQDEPSAASEIDSESLRNQPIPKDMTSDRTDGEVSDPLIIIRIPIEISPCVIRQEGHARFRMRVGDKLVRLGALKIVSEPTLDENSETPVHSDTV